MKKWIVSCLVLLLTSSLLLSGCSSSEETSDGSKEKVKLVWWSHDNPAFVAANKKLIEEYKKVNPNVTIQLQSFPYDAFIQKLKASFAAKNPPDIAQMFGTWVTDYAKKGVLQQAPPFVDQSKFYDAALGAYLVENKLYGLPQEFNLENGGVLARPKMFQDAGVSYPPKTWEDLLAAAQKLTQRSGKKIKVRGFDFTSGDNITFSFLSYILQQKGNYWTDDGHVNFSTPEAIKAMSVLRDLVRDYKVTDMSLFGTEDISDTFFKGGSAMAIRGPWTIAAGLETYKVKDFEYIPMPSLTSDPPYFAAESGWGNVIAKASKHSKEAWDFINFTMEKEQAINWNIKTFTVPSNKEVAQDPKFIEAIPLMKASLDVLQYGTWIGAVQDRDYFFKQINDNFQSIARGSASVEDALKKIETEINKMIDQHKQ